MENSSKAKIKEIFESIQGEGKFTGESQIFVRFTKCNLNCKYCDTNFSFGSEFSPFSLYETLKKFKSKTVSLTGGEPLMETPFLNEFLSNYKQKLNKKIYLETNGVLYRQLEEILPFLDVISMDIKLQSATGQPNCFSQNEKFLLSAKKKDCFVKIVFDENVTKEEIEKTMDLVKKSGVLAVLQPKMPMSENLNLEKIFNSFFDRYENIRLIPQVHKFLDLR